MCVSVREHISGTAGPIFTKFLCRSLVVVARSSCGGVAIPGRSLMSINALLLRVGRRAEYCDQPVCLCVYLSVGLFVCLSLREHISGTAGPIRTKFCVRISCGRGSVLFRRRCDTLCTSGFMDDMTFGRNGRDAGKVGSIQRSLMSMNVLLENVLNRCTRQVLRSQGSSDNVLMIDRFQVSCACQDATRVTCMLGICEFT